MSQNPAAPTVTINLDRERHLLFTLNSLAEMEKLTGRNMLSAEAFDKVSAADARALVWAALIHEDPALTLEQVGSWLHPGNIRQAMDKIAEAWTGSRPEPKEQANTGDPTQQTTVQ